MKRTILGVGFIGFQLMKDIVIKMTDKDELFLVDNDRINLQRVINALEKRGYIRGIIHVLEGDVRDNSFREVAQFHEDKKQRSCDYPWFSLLKDSIVYNLSARVGVKSWTENPYQNYFHNLQVDNNVSEMVRRYHCKKYVYASSSEVLGDGEHLKEGDNFQISSTLRGLYALEKVHGETLAKTLGVPHTIVRFFNIIGPYQDITKGVFPKFIYQLQRNEEVKASTDVRCFCDVRDASQALIILGESELSNTVNICNTENSFTMVELANILKEELKSTSKITLLEDNFIHTRVGDNTLLSEFYKMKYNIYKTIDYYLEAQGIENGRNS